MRRLGLRGLLGVAAALLALLLAGCSGALLDLNSRSNAASPRAQGRTGVVTNELGYLEVEGRTGPGALYSFAVPSGPDWPAWNGRLVLYAHGFVTPGSPIGFTPETDQFKAAFLAEGYAVGYSSYSQNGWAVKDAEIRTRQLRGLFSSYFRPPEKVYLIGASMGGLVSLALAERDPELIDGALLLCGPIGGTKVQLDYILDVLVLTDYYFPQIESVVHFDEKSVIAFPDNPAEYFAGVVTPALTAILASDPAKLLAMAQIDQIKVPAAATPAGQAARVPELVRTWLTAFGFAYLGLEDAFARTHGHLMVDNSETVYTIDGLRVPGELNDKVRRFASTPDAEAYLDNWYLPSGNPRVPVIAVNLTRDDNVPYSAVTAYEALLEPSARARFMPLGVDGFGHCDFLSFDPATGSFVSDPSRSFVGEAVLPAFAALATWVETGERPPAPY